MRRPPDDPADLRSDTPNRVSGTLTVAPRLYDRMNAFLIEKDNVVEQPAAPTDGSLYDPMPDGTGTSAGWQAQPGGRFALAPLAALLVPLGVVALRRR